MLQTKPPFPPVRVHPLRRVWVVCVGLVALTSCQGESLDPQVAPLDDPWVDAIGTGDDELGGAPVTVASAEPRAVDPDPIDLVGVTPAPTGRVELGSTTPPQRREVSRTTPAKPGPEPSTASTSPAPSPTATAHQPTPSAHGPAAKPPSPAPVTRADFRGSYRYVGGSSQRADLEAAIEATASSLPGVVQGIARKRLLQANPVDDAVDIVMVGDTITTRFASGFDVTCVIDGASVHTRGIGGDKLAVRVKSKGSKLVQWMEAKDGVRTVVYTLSPDRNKLTVHHRLTADRLPEPLTFRLSYSRK